MRKLAGSFSTLVFCVVLLFTIFLFPVCRAEVRGENCYSDQFKQDAKGHDILNTYLCMLPCVYCYNWKVDAKDFEEFKKNYQKLFLVYGFKNYDFINKRDKFSDTQVMIMSNDKMVMAIFRGSETKFNKGNFASAVRDWVTTDFAIKKIKKKDWGNRVKVHKGFYRALELVYDDFKEKCKRHMSYNKKPLWVVGHSLGGALATLAAFRLVTDGVSVHQVEVFGSPRVGNESFADVYKSKVPQTFRWVHENDLITMVPPRKILKYCHVVKPDMIYSDGKIVLSADENNKKGKVRDHMGPKYGAALFKALPKTTQALLPDDEDEYENYAKIIKRSDKQDNNSNMADDIKIEKPDKRLPSPRKLPLKEMEKEKNAPRLNEKSNKILNSL